jgi:hypothetical protein
LNQGTTVAVWLCVGVVALLWGMLHLRHTRRALRQQLQVKVVEPGKNATPIGSAKS